MTNYIKNLETGKIELHFDKAEYLALTEAQKAEIKSNFLFSKCGSCWVSRAKEPNTYHAERVAEKLGFTGCEKQGERLSFAEQIERQAERAERRADRFEEYADNAEHRAENLQADFNKYRQDIAWLTQPIIAGHSGSRAFANHRDKVMKRYERGMDEYRKSAYYQDRAATARATASNDKFSDPIYLDNRIRECNKNLRGLQKTIVEIEENIYKLEHGEKLEYYHSHNGTIEKNEAWLETILERYDAEQDKLDFMEDCMSKLGGVKFGPENIKVGYVVKMIRSGKCEIVGAGPKNVSYKILEGGARGMVLTASYAEIEKIIAEKTVAAIENPFSAGDILCLHRPADDSIYRAFQVLKTTEKGIQIQEIVVDHGTPQAGQFRLGSKPERKGIVKSKFSDYVGAYYDDWQMYKYTPKADTKTA